MRRVLERCRRTDLRITVKEEPDRDLAMFTFLARIFVLDSFQGSGSISCGKWAMIIGAMAPASTPQKLSLFN